MVGAITLLKYQQFAYWRRAFSVRGNYDKFSLLFVLIILLSAFRFFSILHKIAKSLANGQTEDLGLLAGIIFLIWILPAFESQRVSEKLANFNFLPLSRNQFSLIRLANVFCVPTSVIALIVSLTAIYPLAFDQNFLFGIAALLFYILLAAFSLTLFVRLLKFGLFRFFVFSAAIILAIGVWKTNFNFIFFPANLFIQIVAGEHQFANFLMLVILTSIAFFSTFIFLRLPNPAKSNRTITPSSLAKIKLPVKFGELLKKDFFAAWKTFDSYLALFIAIVYAVILTAADFSFTSFGAAISETVMGGSILAFNIFGLESAAGFQRLSLLPFKPEDLFIAKNKAFFLLVFSQTFFLFPLIFYKFGAIYLAAAILKFVSINLFYAAWGNILSVKFPFKMNFYDVSFGGSIQDMLMAVALISSAVILPDFLFAGNSTAILLISIALAIFGYLAYKFFLKKAARKLPDEWENIAFKLS